MNTFLTKILTGSAIFFLAATSTWAAGTYSLSGHSEEVQPGFNSLQAVQMVSDTDPGNGNVLFTIPESTTFADLKNLSTDFNVVEGACGGGSPRFQITVLDQNGDKKNIFAYLGQTPNYSCTTDVWQNSGNLLVTGKKFDTSQLSQGTFYDSYTTTLVKYGGLTVTGVQLVTDSGWLFGNQTVLADNVRINDTIYSFEPTRAAAKEMCKTGGYKNFDGENGLPGPFKNQGECVSYFNHTL